MNAANEHIVTNSNDANEYSLLSQYAIGLNRPELNVNAIFEVVNTVNRFQIVY